MNPGTRTCVSMADDHSPGSMAAITPSSTTTVPGPSIPEGVTIVAAAILCTALSLCSDGDGLLQLEIGVTDRHEPQARRQRDRGPCRIDLALRERQLRRRRRGVVIVVQSLAAREPREPLQVGGGVLVRTLAEGVGHGVHCRVQE